MNAKSHYEVFDKTVNVKANIILKMGGQAYITLQQKQPLKPTKTIKSKLYDKFNIYEQIVMQLINIKINSNKDLYFGAVRVMLLEQAR